MKTPKSFTPSRSLDSKLSELMLARKSQCCSAESKGIEFQKYAMLNGSPVDFCEGSEKIRRMGYERHMLPWEAFSIAMDYYEGRATKDCTDAFQEMEYSPDPEWLDMLVFAAGRKVLFFASPKNTTYNESAKEYSCIGTLQCDQDQSREFIIGDLAQPPPSGFFPLASFPEDMVQYLYGRKTSDIPKGFLKRNPYLIIPPQGILRPLSIIGGYALMPNDKAVIRGARQKNLPSGAGDETS